MNEDSILNAMRRAFRIGELLPKDTAGSRVPIDKSLNYEFVISPLGEVGVRFEGGALTKVNNDRDLFEFINNNLMK
ncbi:MAG: hypothetical protein ACJAVR_000562 [Paracoccaceae bacterium]|jgi:hypothetical protein